MLRIAFDHIHSPYDYDSHAHKTGVCLFTALVALGIDGALGYHVSLVPALGAHCRVYDRERFLEARRTFRHEVATTKHDSWRRLCTESTHTDLWSLYRRLSQPRAHGDVDSLSIDGEVVSTDEGKAAALAPIFFLSLPPSRDSCQAAIDFAWGTHQPPGD